MKFDAVLLIGFGGPTHFGEVRTFLDNVLRGSKIPKERYETVIDQYKAIGGSSPYLEIAQRQARGLMSVLRNQNLDLHVYVGMRHWNPFVGETLVHMASDGVTRAAGVVLSPFRSEASWQKYLEAVKAGQSRLGMSAPQVDYVTPWHTHPLFVEAVADQITAALEKIPEDVRESLMWIFTAHSIPLGMDKDSNYSSQIQETAGLVMEKFEGKSWTLAFQSRSGLPQDPWLEPDVGVAVEKAAKSGVKGVLIVPIGFVQDHVEVLYDLDIKAKQIAEERNLSYFRARTVGDSPKFMVMLSEKVQSLIKTP